MARAKKKAAGKSSKSNGRKSKDDKEQEDQDVDMTEAPSDVGGGGGGGSSAHLEDVMSKLPSNRFELELEFIQSLASPAYLHYLATSNYLNDPAFLSYLRYLQYWREEPYNRFITYPHCLHFLDLLLTNDTFRRELASVQFRNFLHEQQFYSWQYRSRNIYGSGGNDDDRDGEVKDGEEGTAAAVSAGGATETRAAVKSAS